jgi:hypothetical protein
MILWLLRLIDCGQFFAMRKALHAVFIPVPPKLPFSAISGGWA